MALQRGGLAGYGPLHQTYSFIQHLAYKTAGYALSPFHSSLMTQYGNIDYLEWIQNAGLRTGNCNWNERENRILRLYWASGSIDVDDAILALAYFLGRQPLDVSDQHKMLENEGQNVLSPLSTQWSSMDSLILAHLVTNEYIEQYRKKPENEAIVVEIDQLVSTMQITTTSQSQSGFVSTETAAVINSEIDQFWCSLQSRDLVRTTQAGEGLAVLTPPVQSDLDEQADDQMDSVESPPPETVEAAVADPHESNTEWPEFELTKEMVSSMLTDFEQSLSTLATGYPVDANLQPQPQSGGPSGSPAVASFIGPVGNFPNPNDRVQQNAGGNNLMIPAIGDVFSPGATSTVLDGNFDISSQIGPISQANSVVSDQGYQCLPPLVQQGQSSQVGGNSQSGPHMRGRAANNDALNPHLFIGPFDAITSTAAVPTQMATQANRKPTSSLTPIPLRPRSRSQPSGGAINPLSYAGVRKTPRREPSPYWKEGEPGRLGLQAQLDQRRLRASSQFASLSPQPPLLLPKARPPQDHLQPKPQDQKLPHRTAEECKMAASRFAMDYKKHYSDPWDCDVGAIDYWKKVAACKVVEELKCSRYRHGDRLHSTQDYVQLTEFQYYIATGNWAFLAGQKQHYSIHVQGLLARFVMIPAVLNQHKELRVPPGAG